MKCNIISNVILMCNNIINININNIIIIIIINENV